MTSLSWILLVLTALLSHTTVAQGDTTNLTHDVNNSNTDVFGILENFDIQKAIKDIQNEGTLEEIIDMVISLGISQTPINSKCARDLLTTVEGLVNFKMWAVKMVDAIGRPHTGILSDFDINWLGSYDECIGVRAITYTNSTLQTDPTRHFDGRYCRIGIPVPTTLSSMVVALQVIGGGHIKVGLCVPNSCNTADVKSIMNIVAHNIFNATTDYTPDAACDEGIPIETKTIVAICIFSILGLLVVIGTLYDIYLRLSDKKGKEGIRTQTDNSKHTTGGNKDVDAKIDLTLANGEKPKDARNVISKKIGEHSNQRSTLEKIFLAFSAYTNGLKILNTNQPKGALTCINGIRFFSMTWVILGHSVDFQAKNGIAYLFTKKVWQWTYYGIYSASVSVDTFFAMSGLLVSYLTLREMKKRGGAKNINWFMFYFHRFWRLTPVYMLVILFLTTIPPHLGDGPQWWYDTYPDGESCDKYWWTNLLYINNYYPGSATMCLAQSWYLANDMHFYILSPLIMIPLYYNAAVGGVVAALFFLGTTAARAVIAKQHEYTALLSGLVGPKPKDGDFFDKLYIPSHTRMGPYIVGLVAGYLLYRYKDTIKIKRTWNLLGWFTCMSIIVLILYGVYPDNHKHFLTVDESVAYVTLHRAGWGLAVCWIIFACATGHGGWINDFLSWSPFAPLSRMSYSTYLVHFIVINHYVQSQRVNVYMTDLQQIYFYLGNVVLSHFAAFVTSLLFEAPMMGLEKIFFKKN